MSQIYLVSVFRLQEILLSDKREIIAAVRFPSQQDKLAMAPEVFIRNESGFIFECTTHYSVRRDCLGSIVEENCVELEFVPLTATCMFERVARPGEGSLWMFDKCKSELSADCRRERLVSFEDHVANMLRRFMGSFSFV